MLGEKRIGRECVMVTVGIVAAVVGLTLMGLVISTDTGLLSSDWGVLWNMGAISGAAAEVSVDCRNRSGPWVHSLGVGPRPRFRGPVCQPLVPPSEGWGSPAVGCGSAAVGCGSAAQVVPSSGMVPLTRKPVMAVLAQVFLLKAP